MPAAWKRRGTLYVVDIEDNRERYAALAKKHGSVKAATGGDIYAVRLRPYSGKEYEELLAEKTAPMLRLTTDGETPKFEIDTDAASATDFMAEVNHTLVRVGVLEVYGFVKHRVREEFVTEDGVLLDGWDENLESVAVTTGDELVDFVANELFSEPAKQAIELRGLLDIQKAIRSRSHLEAGLVKGSSSTPAGSPAVTPPSDGDAGGVPAQRTSTTTKGRKKKTSRRHGTAGT